MIKAFSIFWILFLCFRSVLGLEVDRRYYGDRIVVKFKQQDRSQAKGLSASNDHWRRFQAETESVLKYKRETVNRAKVLKFSDPVSAEELEAYVEKLRLREDIEYAEVDYKRYPMSFPLGAPDDIFYDSQWYLQSNAPPFNRGAINAEEAWQLGATGKGITIAVIDTGITPHIDFASNVINGYDFISLDVNDNSAATAGDGDGRDTNASDPGDIVTEEDKQASSVFTDCAVTGKSTWHGTRIAGLLGAKTDNAIGIAGLVPDANILVVRALGKCGGYSSDIMDAARWAAGLPIAGVPNNPYPSRVVNLSLGGRPSCTNLERAAIAEIVDAGVVVVTAAGNEGQDAFSSSPASCPGAIAVAANTRLGGETNYTNFGTTVDIAAPGGVVNGSCADGYLSSTAICTTSQNLAAEPEGGWDQNTIESIYIISQGTSFSSPIVAGVVAMMLQKDPTLTPQQVYGTLLSTAVAFPQGVAGPQGDAARDCVAQNCGVGIVNAYRAVRAVISADIVAMDFPSKEAIPRSVEPSSTANNEETRRVVSNGGSSAVSWLFFVAFILIIQIFHRFATPK